MRMTLKEYHLRIWGHLTANPECRSKTEALDALEYYGPMMENECAFCTVYHNLCSRCPLGRDHLYVCSGDYYEWAYRIGEGVNKHMQHIFAMRIRDLAYLLHGE